MNSYTKFDMDRYKSVIQNANKKNKADFEVLNNIPKISGTFTNWESKEMLPIIDY